MALERWILDGIDASGNEIIPQNPIINFNNGNYLNNINQLQVKGYQGLTFWIDSAPYPIVIFNPNGLWTWHVNNEVALKSLKFDPLTLIRGKDIIVTIV